MCDEGHCFLALEARGLGGVEESELAFVAKSMRYENDGSRVCAGDL